MSFLSGISPGNLPDVSWSSYVAKLPLAQDIPVSGGSADVLVHEQELCAGEGFEAGLYEELHRGFVRLNSVDWRKVSLSVFSELVSSFLVSALNLYQYGVQGKYLSELKNFCLQLEKSQSLLADDLDKERQDILTTCLSDIQDFGCITLLQLNLERQWRLGSPGQSSLIERISCAAEELEQGQFHSLNLASLYRPLCIELLHLVTHTARLEKRDHSSVFRQFVQDAVGNDVQNAVLILKELNADYDAALSVELSEAIAYKNFLNKESQSSLHQEAVAYLRNMQASLSSAKGDLSLVIASFKSDKYAKSSFASMVNAMEEHVQQHVNLLDTFSSRLEEALEAEGLDGASKWSSDSYDSYMKNREDLTEEAFYQFKVPYVSQILRKGCQLLSWKPSAITWGKREHKKAAAKRKYAKSEEVPEGSRLKHLMKTGALAWLALDGLSVVQRGAAVYCSLLGQESSAFKEFKAAADDLQQFARKPQMERRLNEEADQLLDLLSQFSLQELKSEGLYRKVAGQFPSHMESFIVDLVEGRGDCFEAWTADELQSIRDDFIQQNLSFHPGQFELLPPSKWAETFFSSREQVEVVSLPRDLTQVASDLSAEGRKLLEKYDDFVSRIQKAEDSLSSYLVNEKISLVNQGSVTLSDLSQWKKDVDTFLVDRDLVGEPRQSFWQDLVEEKLRIEKAVTSLENTARDLSREEEQAKELERDRLRTHEFCRSFESYVDEHSEALALSEQDYQALSELIANARERIEQGSSSAEFIQVESELLKERDSLQKRLSSMVVSDLVEEKKELSSLLYAKASENLTGVLFDLFRGHEKDMKRGALIASLVSVYQSRDPVDVSQYWKKLLLGKTWLEIIFNKVFSSNESQVDSELQVQRSIWEFRMLLLSAVFDDVDTHADNANVLSQLTNILNRFETELNGAWKKGFLSDAEVELFLAYKKSWQLRLDLVEVQVPKGVYTVSKFSGMSFDEIFLESPLQTSQSIISNDNNSPLYVYKAVDWESMNPEELLQVLHDYQHKSNFELLRDYSLFVDRFINDLPLPPRSQEDLKNNIWANLPSEMHSETLSIIEDFLYRWVSFKSNDSRKNALYILKLVNIAQAIFYNSEEYLSKAPAVGTAWAESAFNEDKGYTHKNFYAFLLLQHVWRTVGDYEPSTMQMLLEAQYSLECAGVDFHEHLYTGYSEGDNKVLNTHNFLLTDLLSNFRNEVDYLKTPYFPLKIYAKRSFQESLRSRFFQEEDFRQALGRHVDPMMLNFTQHVVELIASLLFMGFSIELIKKNPLLGLVVFILPLVPMLTVDLLQSAKSSLDDVAYIIDSAIVGTVSSCLVLGLGDPQDNLSVTILDLILRLLVAVLGMAYRFFSKDCWAYLANSLHGAVIEGGDLKTTLRSLFATGFLDERLQNFLNSRMPGQSHETLYAIERDLATFLGLDKYLDGNVSEAYLPEYSFYDEGTKSSLFYFNARKGNAWRVNPWQWSSELWPEANKGEVLRLRSLNEYGELQIKNTLGYFSDPVHIIRLQNPDYRDVFHHYMYQSTWLLRSLNAPSGQRVVNAIQNFLQLGLEKADELNDFKMKLFFLKNARRLYGFVEQANADSHLNNHLENPASLIMQAFEKNLPLEQRKYLLRELLLCEHLPGEHRESHAAWIALYAIGYRFGKRERAEEEYLSLAAESVQLKAELGDEELRQMMQSVLQLLGLEWKHAEITVQDNILRCGPYALDKKTLKFSSEGEDLVDLSEVTGLKDKNIESRRRLSESVFEVRLDDGYQYRLTDQGEEGWLWEINLGEKGWAQKVQSDDLDSWTRLHMLGPNYDWSSFSDQQTELWYQSDGVQWTVYERFCVTKDRFKPFEKKFTGKIEGNRFRVFYIDPVSLEATHRLVELEKDSSWEQFASRQKYVTYDTFLNFQTNEVDICVRGEFGDALWLSTKNQNDSTTFYLAEDPNWVLLDSTSFQIKGIGLDREIFVFENQGEIKVRIPHSTLGKYTHIESWSEFGFDKKTGRLTANTAAEALELAYVYALSGSSEALDYIRLAVDLSDDNMASLADEMAVCQRNILNAWGNEVVQSVTAAALASYLPVSHWDWYSLSAVNDYARGTNKVGSLLPKEESQLVEKFKEFYLSNSNASDDMSLEKFHECIEELEGNGSSVQRKIRAAIAQKPTQTIAIDFSKEYTSFKPVDEYFSIKPPRLEESVLEIHDDLQAKMQGLQGHIAKKNMQDLLSDIESYETQLPEEQYEIKGHWRAQVEEIQEEYNAFSNEVDSTVLSLQHVLETLANEGRTVTIVEKDRISVEILMVLFASGNLEHLKEWNPNISDESLTQIKNRMGDYLKIARISQHSKRVRKACAKVLHASDSQRSEKFQVLGKMLSSRPEYEIGEHVSYAVLEYLLNIRLYAHQVEALKNLGQQEKRILEKLMGSGKSKVLAPLYLLLMSQGENLPVMIVPDALKNDMLKSLQMTLGAGFGRVISSFTFDRQTVSNLEEAQAVFQELKQAKEQGKLLLMSDSSFRSLFARMMEMLEGSEGDFSDELIQEMKKSLRLLLQDGSALVDEADTVMAIDKHLRFSLGEKEKIKKEERALSGDLAFVVYSSSKVQSLVKTEMASGSQGSLFHNSIYHDQVKKVILQDVLVRITQNRKNVYRKSLVQYLENLSTEDRSRLERYLLEEGEIEFFDTLPEVYQDFFALLRGQINELMPRALSMHLNENYGIGKESDQAIPFSGIGQALEGSQFASHYLTADLTVFAYLTDGISRERLAVEIEKWQKAALQEMEDKKNISIEQTIAYKKYCRIATGSSKRDARVPLLDEGAVDYVWNEIHSDKELLLSAIDLLILRDIGYYSTNVVADAGVYAFLSQLTQGFTGTVENEGIFSHDFEILRETGTQGRIASTIWKKCGQDISVMDFSTGDSLANQVENILNGVEKSQSLNAIADAGAYFRKIRDNQLIAEAFLKADKESRWKGVVYYDLKGEQKVLLKDSWTVVSLENCTLKENERLTFYDGGHCTGSDISQDPKANLLILLGQQNTLRDLGQTIYRFRQIEKGQSASIAISKDEEELIRKDLGLREGQKLSLIDLLQYMFVVSGSKTEKQNLAATRMRMNTAVIRAIYPVLLDPDLSVEDARSLARSLQSLFVKENSIDPVKLFSGKQEEVCVHEMIDKEKENLIEKVHTCFDTFPFLEERLDKQAIINEIHNAIVYKDLPIHLSLASAGELTGDEVVTVLEQAKEQAEHEEEAWEEEQAQHELTNQIKNGRLPAQDTIAYKDWDMNKIKSVKSAIQAGGYDEYDQVFDDELKYSENFFSSDSDKLSWKPRIFDPYRNLSRFALVHEKEDGKLDFIALDSRDALHWTKELDDPEKDAMWQGYTLYSLDFGIMARTESSGPDADLLENPDFQRLKVQFKLFLGDVDYSEGEAEILKTYLNRWDTRQMQEFYEDEILPGRSDLEKRYFSSILASLLYR